MPTVYYRTSLVGGTIDSVDGIDGAALADLDMALVPDGEQFYIFRLDADSGLTESSPAVIRPDNNAGDKRWIRQVATTLPPGHIDGLECSHAADTDHDITVAVGSCRDNSDTYDCVLASALTKQIDAAWAAGTNAGGMIGTLAANTLYLFGLLRNNTTGAIDAGWNTTATAPSGWSWMRTLDYYKTDGSSNIIGVVDVFRGNVVERQWKAVQVVSTGLTSTPYVFQSLGAFVPPTILQPEAVICGYGSTAGTLYLSVDSSNDVVVISQGTTNPASPPNFIFLPLIFQSGNWGIYYKGVGASYTMTLSKVRFKR